MSIINTLYSVLIYMIELARADVEVRLGFPAPGFMIMTPSFSILALVSVTEV